MRSTPWTSTVQAECRYELRDNAGQLLGSTASHAEAVRMLQAYVLTQPGREDDVEIHSLDAYGQLIAREDILDVELSPQ